MKLKSNTFRYSSLYIAMIQYYKTPINIVSSRDHYCSIIGTAFHPVVLADGEKLEPVKNCISFNSAKFVNVPRSGLELTAAAKRKQQEFRV